MAAAKAAHQTVLNVIAGTRAVFPILCRGVLDVVVVETNVGFDHQLLRKVVVYFAPVSRIKNK